MPVRPSRPSRRRTRTIEKFFGSAVGYVVFPTIAKGGFVVAGAGGDGILFLGGQAVGKLSLIHI